MNKHMIIVGLGAPELSAAIASSIRAADSPIIIIADEEKERGINIQKPAPLLITNYEVIEPMISTIFPEPLNYINGKILPRKKRKK